MILTLALLFNLIIIGCEIYTFIKLRKKIDILKYYTYIQNFLTLVSSIIFSIYLVFAIFLNSTIPEFAKGLRYVTTCGLLATTFIYIVFLSSNSKNVITEKDFKTELSPKKANFILHYFCPIISAISFVALERQIPLNNSIWTALVMLPSCLYWIMYLILSATKLWEEPYNFSSKSKKKNILLEILTVISLPVSFILISFVLWNIK